ncbi:hypothetical protein FN846DRAFT_893950 [Sphaerosporella brunnea]|uniref:Uncharacterized protein n=1 Tax=Sphaerosporella brunnea TaxID=1250544 RepID=A0A5J5EKP4_9PEZI|nr:hypothetical protein FN846DRAFT_893950 [Sphaerosporella brunnea]
MVQDEQMNHLPYVLPSVPDHELFTTGQDGEINLADILINNLPKTDTIQELSGLDYKFLSPQYTHYFELEEFKNLHAYLDAEASTFEGQALSTDHHPYPTKAICWAAVQCAKFRVTASKMQKANSTRSKSLIRYEYFDCVLFQLLGVYAYFLRFFKTRHRSYQCWIAIKRSQ